MSTPIHSPGIRNTPARRTQGFGMIEMMVTVAILAIIAAMAAPNLTDFISRQRVVSPAEDIRGLLQQARTEAMKQSTNITVSVIGSGTSWKLGLSDAGNCTTAATCQIVDSSTAGATNRITRMLDGANYKDASVTTTTANFTYGQNGLLTPTLAANNDIQISHGGWGLTVRISTIGRVSICHQSGKNPGAYKPCAAAAQAEQ